MEISEADLFAEADAFVKRHPGLAGDAERRHHLQAWTLIALGSRETSLSRYYEAHPGDGGHGCGPWQDDDRSDPHAHTRTLGDYADLAASELADNLRYYKGDLRSALAAYNAGRGGANRGIAAGNVDRFTTHGNYSADVVARLHALQRRAAHH